MALVIVVEKARDCIVDPNDTYTFVVSLYLLDLLNNAKVLGQALHSYWVYETFHPMFSRS